MVDYRLASEFGVALPDAVAASAVARIRVMGLGEAGNKKKTFDAPSNVLFIPAEYWAVNCCLPCGGGSCFDCIEPIALDCCDPAGGGGEEEVIEYDDNGQVASRCCLPPGEYTGNFVYESSGICWYSIRNPIPFCFWNFIAVRKSLCGFYCPSTISYTAYGNCTGRARCVVH